MVFLLLAFGFAPVLMAQTQPRTVHVFVALADNKNQGIVPVAAILGNGDVPAHNLYWGSAYGYRTFFSRNADWQLAACRSRNFSCQKIFYYGSGIFLFAIHGIVHAAHVFSGDAAA